MARAARSGPGPRRAAAPLSARLLLAAALLAAVPGPAAATRATPAWADYHADLAGTQAWLLLARGRLDEAEVRAREAITLRPTDAPGWAALARIAVSRAQWTKASEAAAALLAHHPEHLEGLGLAAQAAIELGDAGRARDAYERLRGLAPTAPGPLVGLALIAARLDGDTPGAIAHLRRATLHGDPALPTLLLRPGWEPLRDDEAFVAALNALIAELHASE